MSRINDPEALAHLEKRMVDTFGVSHREYDAGALGHSVPRAHFNAALRVADSSGTAELLARWDAERRKSNAGKKALIPLRALVVLYLSTRRWGLVSPIRRSPELSPTGFGPNTSRNSGSAQSRAMSITGTGEYPRPPTDLLR